MKKKRIRQNFRMLYLAIMYFIVLYIIFFENDGILKINDAWDVVMWLLFIVLSIGIPIYFILYLFFLGIEVTTEGVSFGFAKDVKGLEKEKRKTKKWYYISFDEIYDIRCFHRFQSNMFEITILIIKKDGTVYDITFANGYFLSKTKKTINRFFNQYRNGKIEYEREYRPKFEKKDVIYIRV